MLSRSNINSLGVCPEVDRFYKLNEQTETPIETEAQEPTLSM